MASCRCCRRGCRLAAIGNRFSHPHVVHFRTSISAHGFFPPLLRFSTSFVHVDPSIKSVSQRLQMVCLMAGEILICDLSDIDRRSDTNLRGAASDGGAVVAVPGTLPSSVTIACGSGVAVDFVVWLDDCAVARYAAAWYKYDILLCRTLFGTWTPPLVPLSFAILR
jgi:hypothetical protein